VSTALVERSRCSETVSVRRRCRRDRLPCILDDEQDHDNDNEQQPTLNAY